MTFLFLNASGRHTNCCIIASLMCYARIRLCPSRVLQLSCNDLCAIINGGSLALADAAIERIDLCCSSSFVWEKPADSNNDTDIMAITVSTLPSLGCVVNIAVQGRIEGQLLAAYVDELINRCSDMRKIMFRKLMELQ